MEQWVRLAIFALILVSFVRRILKAATTQKRGTQPVSLRMSRPERGRKNDFRDVPPPPENPELG
jgi:hypothetical protein